MLAEGPTGQQVLVPGPTHDGRVRAAIERVPRDQYWRMKMETGPHRLIAIELTAPTPPRLREGRAPARLNADMERIIVEELIDPQRGGWRYGALSLFVVEPGAQISGEDDEPVGLPN